MIMMTTIITIISNPPVTDPGSVENHSAENDACEPGQTLSNSNLESKGSHTLGKPSFANSAVFLPDPGVSGVRSMGPGVSTYGTLVETLLM